MIEEKSSFEKAIDQNIKENESPFVMLAIDPGTKTGATLYTSINSKKYYSTMLWNNKPLTKTKKREGEPKHFRLKHLYDRLENALSIYEKIDVIICEGALGFQTSKLAVEASHKFRGTIELFCALNGIKYVEIQPNDLKYFALGKRSGEKQEMIEKAKYLGYDGNDDNEADSFLIAKWYLSTL